MVSVIEEIDRLESLSTFELRILWRRHWIEPPPMRLSKDLLIRGIAWQLQAKVRSGLSKADQRKLGMLAKAAADQREAARADGTEASAMAGWGGAGKFAVSAPVVPSIVLREGNRLVREWNGTTHTVLVLASGFEWQGRPYRSLSQIAKAITGAHWSGPRFFGLVKRKPERRETPAIPCSAEQPAAYANAGLAARSAP
jgi:Protein of unknown function (DUF2924)